MLGAMHPYVFMTWWSANHNISLRGVVLG